MADPVELSPGQLSESFLLCCEACLPFIDSVVPWVMTVWVCNSNELCYLP